VLFLLACAAQGMEDFVEFVTLCHFSLVFLVRGVDATPIFARVLVIGLLAQAVCYAICHHKCPSPCTHDKFMPWGRSIRCAEMYSTSFRPVAAQKWGGRLGRKCRNTCSGKGRLVH